MKTVKIRKHEFIVESTHSCLFPGESFEQAFDPVESADLIFIALTSLRAIEWAWLRWHLDHQYQPIKTNLIADAMRVIQAMADGKFPKGEDDERGLHDMMLMHCAILSGDRSTMKKAAEHVRFAIRGSKRYQHDAAVAGILASRVLGDRKREFVQFELEQERKATGVHSFPSNALLRSFVEQDYASFNRLADGAVQEFWSEKRLARVARTSAGEPVVCEEKENRIVINTLQIHPHFRWAYVEAAFAKLAILDNAIISTDDFWFPLQFVQSFS